MFRLESHAGFRCAECRRPDPRHPGISFIQRSYFLATGNEDEIELSPGFGEAIAAGQHSRPQPMGRAQNRYWWIYRDLIYSTPDRLSRAAVLRLAERAGVEVATAGARIAAPERRRREGHPFPTPPRQRQWGLGREAAQI